jgi:hypothetical protein
MKKLNIVFRFVLMIAIPIGLINCGPSAEQLEAQRISDSGQLDKALSENPTLAKDIKLSTKTPSDKKLIKTAELKFKVKNVPTATEKIEDLAARYDGYITYSNLQNRQENYERVQNARDSVMICQQITVFNEMQLRIPNIKLDSFIRNLNPMVVFLDHRVIKMDDVTYRYLKNQKKTERLNNYARRQVNHIDEANSKLKETTSAEENLLDKQIQNDETKISNLELEDQLKYCNLSIEIYQKPILVKEVIFDFNYVSESKPNFFVRAMDSVIYGWWIFEEIILFLVRLWWIVLLVLTGLVVLRYFSRKKK